MNHLKPTDRAYIAGILDGEGYLAVTRRKFPENRSGYAYRITVEVVSTDKPLLDWLKRTTGIGSVICKRKASGNWKQAWRWTCWSQQSVALLKQVKKYLLLKGKQADIMLQFDYALRKPGSFGLRPKERRQQERAYDKCKVLNHRGTK